MNIERIEIAQKYAQAFLNLFGDSLTSEVLINLKRLQIDIKKQHAYLILLSVPLITQAKKQKLLWDLFAYYHMPQSFDRLIAVLIEHRCIELLAEVLEQIVIEYKMRHAIEDFVITSSDTLNSDQLQQVIAFIQNNVHKTIMTHVNIDKKLIAGLRLQSDTLLWEYSISKHCKIIEKSFGSKDAYGY